MNKIKCSAVLVVEGKMDKDLIESFMDVDIITTNGSEVSRGTIDYIQEISKKRQIIILTDPDAPGKRIRDIINQNVPGCLNAFVPKNKAIKGHKVGVAESSKDVILEALENSGYLCELTKEGIIFVDDEDTNTGVVIHIQTMT